MSRHIEGLDGLRGVAVLAVLGFHALPGALAGGFIGVDIFFVVSGFVITRTYFDQLQTGRTPLSEFYSKRIRRLAPAYLAVLIATTVAAYILLPPPLLKKHALALGAQPLVQNFVFWSQGDYFDSAFTKPLLHTWSLAIEEQFYLCYGVLILVARRWSRLALPLVVLATVASYAVGHVVAGVSPPTAFYVLPTRGWELALGVLAARVPFQPGRAATAGRALGLALIAVSVAAFDRASGFPGAQALAACAGTALVSWSLAPGAPRSRLLEHPTLTYVGRTSYSLYLWHWPVIALASTRAGHPLTLPQGLAAAGGSFLLSHASYHWLEDPIRRRAWLPRDRNLIGATALLGIAVFGTALALNLSDGAVGRYGPELATLYRAQQERLDNRCSALSRLRNFPSEMCRQNDVDGPDGVLIVGDSHADRLDETIADIGAVEGRAVYLAARNCSIEDFGSDGATGKPYCNRDVLASLLGDVAKHEIGYVFGISFLQPELGEEALQRGVDLFLAAGVRQVVLMQVVPTGDYFDPGAHVAALRAGIQRPRAISLQDHAQAIRAQRDVLNSIRAHTPAVTVLDPASALCRDGVCSFERDGKPLYTDTNHLSSAGAQALTPMWTKAIRELHGGPPASHPKRPNHS